MKYWKKHLKAIAILLIVLLSAGVMSVACAQTTQQSKLALDMVLVVDESGSMSAAVNNMHDRYGYRHDAAASLIGLCDAEKSRVALLPFSTNVITTIDGVNELKEIDITSHNDTRRKMLKLLENDGTDYSTLYGYSRKYGGETDLGSALERAVEILVENKSDNHPVIVLLSDGEIEISDSNGGKFIPNRQKILRRIRNMRPYQAICEIMNCFEYIKNIKGASQWFSIYTLLSMAQYCNQINQLLEEIDNLGEVHDIDERIVLTTMHSSKGQEYEKVIIIDAIEDFIPGNLRMGEDYSYDPEEERRIFYVALTRAEKELDILHPQSYYSHYYSPSCFVSEYTLGNVNVRQMMSNAKIQQDALNQRMFHFAR